MDQLSEMFYDFTQHFCLSGQMVKKIEGVTERHFRVSACFLTGLKGTSDPIISPGGPFGAFSSFLTVSLKASKKHTICGGQKLHLDPYIAFLVPGWQEG